MVSSPSSYSDFSEFCSSDRDGMTPRGSVHGSSLPGSPQSLCSYDSASGSHLASSNGSNFSNDNSNADPRPTWRLVWCHERCHKEDEEALRDTISKVSSEHGGGITCFKKAKTFEAWCTRKPRPPYVLLTDGRELKPCMQALATMPHNQPLLTIVLSEKAKHATRVGQWVQDLPSQGILKSVQIIREIDQLGPLLLACSASCLLGSQAPPSQKKPAVATASRPLATFPPCHIALPRASPSFYRVIASEEKVELATSPMALQRNAYTTGDATRKQAASSVMGMMQWVQPQLCKTMDAGFTPELPFLLKNSSEIAPPVMEVLASALLGDVNTDELAKLLMGAAPEVYED